MNFFASNYMEKIAKEIVSDIECKYKGRNPITLVLHNLLTQIERIFLMHY